MSQGRCASSGRQPPGSTLALPFSLFRLRFIADVSPDALALLKNYSWPGNVRELKAEVERSVLFAKDGVIDAHSFGPAIRGTREKTNGESAGDSSLIDQEKRTILSALSSAKGNISRAAETLGIARSTLYHKIRRLGIRVS